MLRRIAPIALSAVFLASGCAVNSEYNNPIVTLTPVQVKTDAKIIEGLIVLNKNEISVASLAEKRASNKAVKNYAVWMHKAHSDNLHETEIVSQKIGIMPEKGNISAVLQTKGKQELNRLSHLHNKAFDKAYIAAMIKDHTAALQLVDQKLLSQATSPLLRKQLEMTASHIKHHLEQAKSIQSEIR